MLVGPYAGPGINDFLSNLTPGVSMVHVALPLYVFGVFHRSYCRGDGTNSQALLDHVREDARIIQGDRLRKAGAVSLETLALFVVS